jgi:cytochrome P450
MRDLVSQETLRNPFAFYKQLHEQGRLAHFTLGTVEIWIVATTYAESIELLKDPRLAIDRRNTSAQDIPNPSFGGALARLISRTMLGTDPPDHTRLRALVSKAFTPRMIEQLRPRIQQITDDLLDAVEGKGSMDLIADFAFPLPLMVITDLLGIPATESKPFRAWAQELLASLATPENETGGMVAAEAFLAYVKTLLARKRAHPGDDLTSHLLQAEEQGNTLSEDELVTMIWLLIMAGHETTVNLLSNGTLVLLEHPDQMRLLHTDPSLLPLAVDELLRYTTPVLCAFARWAREDISLYGQMIRQGEQVRISLTAANGDPQQFSNPETLDITRQINPHLAFSRGIHHCLGAPLARLEGQIAFGTLLQRLPDLRLACEPELLSWKPLPYMRTLNALPVAFAKR